MKEHNALPKPARDQMAREQHAGAAVHPDADMLTALCEGALGEAERSRVMDHIARCGECREVVFLAAPDLAAEPVPAVAPVVSRWRRFMPAVAAAAALVVVGSAVLLNRSSSSKAELRKAAEIETYIKAPAAGSNLPQVARADEAQSSEPKKQTASAPRPEAAEKTFATKEKVAPVLGGMVADQKNEARRFDLPTVGGPVQQQATASGPHGALVPKGNATNYQSLAVTPPQPAPVVPKAAGKYGPIEAAGNASNYAYAIPGSKDEGAVGAVTKSAAPAPVLQAKAAPEKQAQKPASPPAAQSESVEVTAADSMVTAEMADSSTQLAKSKKSTGYSSMETTSRDLRTVRAHWRITDAGQLQRKLGNGEWTSVFTDANVRFRVVSVIGDDVWAGGMTGALYHTTDAGERWSKVPIQGMTEIITELRFRNAQSGEVKTESGAVWQTSDGGAHWIRK